jgi:hypothetical protein
MEEMKDGRKERRKDGMEGRTVQEGNKKCEGRKEARTVKKGRKTL